MAIPDYQTMMLPFLGIVSDGEEHPIREVIDTLGDQFSLTPAERDELLPSGSDRTFSNRVRWARTYLGHALLVEAPRRGVMKITPRGLQVLSEKPNRVDIKLLEQFPEFLEFRKGRSRDSVDSSLTIGPSGQTPEDALAAAYRALRASIEAEVLQMVRNSSPDFFEQVVVDVLVKMGYGGSREDAGRAIGRSGDEGIDGIIKEDRLGLDVILVQAKRWDSPVGRPEIQRFAGALQGQRSRKGVFITTSSFTRAAHDYAASIDSRIVLVDGGMLAGLVVDNNVGVVPARAYEVKQIDQEFFDEG